MSPASLLWEKRPPGPLTWQLRIPQSCRATRRHGGASAPGSVLTYREAKTGVGMVETFQFLRLLQPGGVILEKKSAAYL